MLLLVLLVILLLASSRRRIELPPTHQIVVQDNTSGIRWALSLLLAILITAFIANPQGTVKVLAKLFELMLTN